MKETRFLIKLLKEGRIEFVEPSEEIGESYINKSESYLESSRILIKNNKREEAVSMAYYSMYQIVIALLYKTGIKSENHTASMIILKEVYGIDNEEIMKAKKERIDKQYYVDFKITNEEVREMIKQAKGFYNIIYAFIDRMNNQEIKNYRNKLRNLLNIKWVKEDK